MMAFPDPRRRNLRDAGRQPRCVALLAVCALHARGREAAPHYQPHGIPARLCRPCARSRAHPYRLASSGAFDVVFKPDKGWVLPATAIIPPRSTGARDLVGLAALQTIEPKTARADWLHYIGLDTPPKGSGTAITCQRRQGPRLAALITGNSERHRRSAAARPACSCASPATTKASWPARVFEPQGDPADWLDKNVMDVDRRRIADVDRQRRPAAQSYAVRARHADRSRISR